MHISSNGEEGNEVTYKMEKLVNLKLTYLFYQSLVKRKFKQWNWDFIISVPENISIPNQRTRFLRLLHRKHLSRDTGARCCTIWEIICFHLPFTTFASDTNLNPELSGLALRLSVWLQIPARVLSFEFNNQIKTWKTWPALENEMSLPKPQTSRGMVWWDKGDLNSRLIISPNFYISLSFFS